MPTFEAALFAESLTLKFKDESEFASKMFAARAGKRYDKIMQGRTAECMESIHAFVDRDTGFVYKAAGINSPAKNINGVPDIRFEDVNKAIEASDLYGSYLYKR